MLPAHSGEDFCEACQANRTIPDLSDADRLTCWQLLEVAKHRLIYGLMRMRLPLVSKFKDPARGLAFDFLAGPGGAFRENQQVMTGHGDGLITINVAEADDAEREKHRQDMDEPYRTLLGHFRHEIGHYYWDRLVADGPGSTRSARCSATSADYAAALRAALRATARPPTGRSASSAPTPRASVGGLGRDLGALPAHRRHAGDGARLRPARAARRRVAIPRWR